MSATGEHQAEQFYDIPVDFAPLDRPFRTLSTTESENEDESSNPLFVKRRKPKKKKTASKTKKEAKSGNESGMSSAMTKDETSSMMSYLTSKDKNVSHAHIEKFLHKSKIKYSVDEIRTAFENAKSMIGSNDKPPAGDDHKRIVQKWKKIVDVMKSKSNDDDEEEVPGGSFSKSKAISILPPKPADTVKEGHKRLKLIKDARSAQKFEKLVPNSPNVMKNDNFPDEQIEMRVVKGKPKGRVRTKKEEASLLSATMSMDTGQKSPLALVTMKKGAKKPQIDNNPTEGFYRDFKFIYVVLPEPVDELPRE